MTFFMSDLNTEDKEKAAKEIFRTLEVDYLPFNLLRVCGYDFRLCSRVAYMLAVDLLRPESKRIHEKGLILQRLGLHDFNENDPIIFPDYMPVRYMGDIGWKRIFVINRCSFLSPDALIGVRNGEGKYPLPPSMLRVIKGLKETGLCYKGWILYRLDSLATDDMTAMIALRLEKNFTLEFVHFPKDASPEILFRWEDS